MIVKVKKDTRDIVKLVAFDDGYVKIAGGMGLLFLSLDVLIIAILVIIWDEILPYIDQTPFGAFIPFLSILCLCCYGSFPRFVKYITINKKDGYIEVFNLVFTRGARLTDVHHVWVQEERYKREQAWLQLKDRDEPLLLFTRNPGDGGTTTREAISLIEKHLTIALQAHDMVLGSYVSSDARNMKGWRDEGLECMENDHVQEAIRAFEHAVNQDTRDAFSWMDLGVLRERVGDVDGAIKAYSYLLELRPRNILALRRLAILAGKGHPTVQAARKKSALATAWNGTSIVLLIVGVFMCMITGALMIAAIFMPGFLVAGTDWPVPDVAGRIQYLVTSGILYAIGTLLVFVSVKGQVFKDNFRAGFAAIHLFIQYILLGLVLICMSSTVFMSGLDVAREGIIALNPNRLMLIAGVVVLFLMPLYAAFAAIMGLTKNDKGNDFNLGQREIFESIGRLAGGPLATIGLVLLAFHVGRATPIFIIILDAGMPFCYYPFFHRGLATKYRLVPGILMEASVLLMVSLGPLGIVYLLTGGFAIYLLVVVERARATDRGDDDVEDLCPSPRG